MDARLAKQRRSEKIAKFLRDFTDLLGKPAQNQGVSARVKSALARFNIPVVLRRVQLAKKALNRRKIS
ncbi:MAG: FIMAH domain-containing protein [Campylobacter sp.]